MKTCEKCGQNFEIYPEDRAFYEKIQVPEPRNCPECRLIRRLCERNTRHLYKRKCDFSGETIISQYHENQPFPVYKPEIWWSDKWDALDYGQEFDFSRTFFEQFKELKHKVPHTALFVIGGTMENSDYNNCAGYLKNCYLISESDYDEDCYYSNLLKHCTNVVDCSVCYNCELCYQCIDCAGCYNVQYSQDAENSRDSYFLYNCKSCSDCIGCINQRHQKFMIFNQQYSQEDYEKEKQKLLSNIPLLERKTREFFATQIHKNLKQENNENSLGDHLYNSKNAFYCFDSKDLEDCRYCAKLSLGVRSSMDYNSWGDKGELVYQSSSCGDNVYNIQFCTTCTTNVSNAQYCDQCTGSSDIFGCVGLRKNQYCILNKQYSKEEYFKLREKIIEHMGGRRADASAEMKRGSGSAGPNELELKNQEYGEYFPIDICAFAYNEAFVIDHFPLTREQALAQGYQWREFEMPIGPRTSIEIQTCKKCQKNFRIIPQELKFYQQMSIAIPEKCPDCRHAERMELRNPLRLYKRKCDQCQQEMFTTYPPERKEKIYCEKCYLETTYN